MVARFPLGSGTIGVLALQGGVQEHLEHLQRCAIPCRAVRRAADLDDTVRGLILPGGESSTISRLLFKYGLDEAIVTAWRRGLKIWGTCAGAILLARSGDESIKPLGLMDISVTRNAFGSQLDSFTCEATIQEVASYPVPLTFIRAPKIVAVGPDVRVLLTIEDYIAAAEDKQCLATIFHPELTADLAFHRYFAAKCDLVSRKSPPREDALHWLPTSWMHVAR
jgi:5'-phosphate synthase pdxT subunit